MSNKYWAVIPAAGIGSRMESEIPKQYLKINKKTILEHTLDCFLDHPEISGLVVVISTEDKIWKDLAVVTDKTILIADGGMERSDSVLSGLNTLEKIASQSDWVLVHDAARPCLRREDIDNLINSIAAHEVGGLLAAPVKDTMKRSTSNDNKVAGTIERKDLWHALTPQMFRLSDLKQALENVQQKNLSITDESQAMELMDKKPLLVEGHADNIKITQPEDLRLAKIYLESMT